MADVEPQRDTPTEQEREAAGGAGNYEGTPISDDEFAEVWEPPSARGDGGEDESGGDMAGGDQAGSGGGDQAESGGGDQAESGGGTGV